MTSPLSFKVYGDVGYVGALRFAEDAASLVGNTGEGARVKVAGRVVWHEGREAFSAGDSFDEAAEIMHERACAHAREHPLG